MDRPAPTEGPAARQAPAPGLDAALEALAADREATLAALDELVRIPGVSAEGFPEAPLEHSARATADLLAAWGLEGAEVVHHPGAPPYVLAEWNGAGLDAPTVLVYGHHDVQPPGDVSKWRSPPWEPTVRNGRLFGRGAVDDKAGVVLHAAALRAWLVSGGLPVNVRVIVEGEEEVGSPHLADFLAAHRERLAADCLVLTDTCNLDTGVPALTVSLRGLVAADLTVAALEGPLHSGIWGGPVPDPAQALAKLLARLSDDRGRVAVPGIDPGPAAPGHGSLPFDAARFREQGGLLDGVPLLTEGGGATYGATWDRPAVTVTAVEAGAWENAVNQILPRARARVTLRLAPEQDPERALAALVAFLEKDPPFGCRVTVTPHPPSGGWRTRPGGDYFAAAHRALAKGYGREAVEIGCGGSIPFVEPFARSMGGVPALLLGVEDPSCRAHGENESLSLEDFDKACRAAVHLYGEIGRLAGGRKGKP